MECAGEGQKQGKRNRIMGYRDRIMDRELKEFKAFKKRKFYHGFRRKTDLERRGDKEQNLAGREENMRT